MSSTSVALGAAWGVVLAIPLVWRSRRLAVGARTTALGQRPTDQPVGRRVPALAAAIMRWSGPFGRVAGALGRRRAARRGDAVIEHALPVTVDLLAVAVGAGCTPYLAVETVARWAPPPLATRLDGVCRACALGAGFADALDDLAAEAPVLRPLVDALLSSDRYGAPVGDALGRLATEERAALRRRAETRARTVPVRLLFPLVFLVLPAFGLLTVAPTLLTGFMRT